MGNVINITQSITKIDAGIYDVEITVNSGDSKIYEYSGTNGIYPLYNSLMRTLKEMNDAKINLNTNSAKFAREIAGTPNRNTRMLEILNDTKALKNLTIDVTVEK